MFAHGPRTGAAGRVVRSAVARMNSFASQLASLATPRISVAIPIYNEEAIIPELLRRTLAVLDGLPGGPHEIVIVDDGSSDLSSHVLQQFVDHEPRLTVVRLSRNFGHQAALGAALDHVTGDAVVLMDGDLQDAPEYIPEFVHEFRLGSDVVYAIRTGRKEPLWLRACYRAFYWLIARMAHVQLPENAGDFGLLSRRVVELLRQTPERHRYWRGLRSWVGFQQTGVRVQRDARHAGRSKYNLRKLIGLALDGILSFSVFPLRAAAACGMLAVLSALAYAVYAVAAKLLWTQSPQGFTSLLVAMVFLCGIQLVFLGLIGEYIGRIYEQVKQRPFYVVRQILRHPCKAAMPKPTNACTESTGGGEPARNSLWLPSSSTSDIPAETSWM
jgi:polyisoprenyl-phosphate glycosyltransferase